MYWLMEIFRYGNEQLSCVMKNNHLLCKITVHKLVNRRHNILREGAGENNITLFLTT